MSEKTCPSATCAPGAKLIGVVGGDGRVKHLRTPLAVDEGFVATARAQGEPEARMRFATPCASGSCGHWTGEACGLITRVLERIEAAADAAPAERLPGCAIRSSCRWFSQEGRTACLSCDLVVRQPCGAI